MWFARLSGGGGGGGAPQIAHIQAVPVYAIAAAPPSGGGGGYGNF